MFVTLLMMALAAIAPFLIVSSIFLGCTARWRSIGWWLLASGLVTGSVVLLAMGEPLHEPVLTSAILFGCGYTLGTGAYALWMLIRRKQLVRLKSA